VNAADPQRLDIGKELKFGRRTEDEMKRRALWDSVWTGSHPPLMTKGKQHPTWKGKGKIPDVNPEKATLRKDEL